MRKQRVKLSDQIRQAVDASGVSRYRISKTLGIAESTMSRFMAGKGGLSMEYIDDLADLLNRRIQRPQPIGAPTDGVHQQSSVGRDGARPRETR
jgi:predicted XRE-type DNA-binding protein